ncbi:hypothetical protein, partial [Aeromonas dhakensis]|uniref:hypothetical protein n=1 Tax=Aeromonas dhakensis TaxID=196024 RepID=UPI00195D547E
MSRNRRQPQQVKAVCERFKEALELLDLTPATAFESLGYQTPSTLYSVVAGRCLPDLTRLLELSQLRAPSGYRVNFDWLITGAGEKLIIEDGKEEQELSGIIRILSRCSKA